jgi:DNA-binding MarR family transcriptional regulator
MGRTTDVRVRSGTPEGAGDGEPGAGDGITGHEHDPELVARLRIAVARLARLLRQQSDAEVTPSQQSVLATVLRLGPIALGELAAVERVRPPSMTRIVGFLEEAGLLAREVDRSDRRVVRVHATDAGRAYAERTRNQRDAWLSQRLAALSPADQRDLVRATALLEKLVDPELLSSAPAVAGPPAGGHAGTIGARAGRS